MGAPSAKIQRTAEFKPNHLSLCDPLSFVAQRGGNLLHAIQTFSNIVPPGAAVICKYLHCHKMSPPVCYSYDKWPWLFQLEGTKDSVSGYRRMYLLVEDVLIPFEGERVSQGHAVLPRPPVIPLACPPRTQGLEK